MESVTTRSNEVNVDEVISEDLFFFPFFLFSFPLKYRLRAQINLWKSAVGATYHPESFYCSWQETSRTG
jgi:hypothetical protein